MIDRFAYCSRSSLYYDLDADKLCTHMQRPLTLIVIAGICLDDARSSDVE